MSSSVSKNKKKRQRSASSEGGTSFVQNVTSRMSSFLPSSITKWFSSPSSSDTNGSAPAADLSDSSTEDEGLESTAAPEPPKKRMRYNTPLCYEDYSSADIISTVGSIKTPDSSYSSYNSTPFPTRSTLNAPAVSPNEEDMENTANKRKKPKIEHTVLSVGQSVAGKRKTLFDRVYAEQSTKASSQTSLNAVCGVHQPYFKSAYFVSPFFTDSKGTYINNSPTYVNRPNIKRKNVAVVKKYVASDDSAISNSSRRILDLLEQYSSPVSDAKRIAQCTAPTDDRFNTTESHSSSHSNMHTTYRMQELHVPTMASILRLKQKSRLMDTTSAARQLIASHSSAINNPYPSTSHGKTTEMEQTHKMTTKLKARVTRTNRGNQNDFEDATPVKLPTPALNIDHDKLPNFSFGMPGPQLPSSATSTPKSIFEASTNKMELSPSNTEVMLNFKFSEPANLSCSNMENVSPIPYHQIISPERRIELNINQSKDNSFTAIGASEKPPQNSSVKLNDWTCSECWVGNKADANKCVCCGAKQPSSNTEKRAKCTVCKLADSQALKDKCVNCDKVQVSNLASPIVATTTGDASKWKCDECWVSNDSSAEKCACCGSANGKKAESVPPTLTSAAAPAAKRDDADWKCDDCWISNKSGADKCAACGAAKPGANTGAPPPPTFGSSQFRTSSTNNIDQAQKKDTWECKTCLVRNESTVSSCVCCDTQRENVNKMPAQKFNFGMNNSFKFGIDPTLQEAALAKQPEVGFTLNTSKEQSEKNNNILDATPTFPLASSTKTLDENTESFINLVSKPSFTFGIPNKSAPAPAAMFRSLSPAKAVGQEREKSQDIPQIDISALDQSQPSSKSNAFTAPLADANKEVTSVSIALKPAAMSAEKPQQPNTFTFASSSLKPAVFGTTKSTDEPATRNLFTPPSQTVAATTAPAMVFFNKTESTAPSLFEKPNSITSSTVPLFQSGETTATAAPSSVAPTAPLFSFGSNLATNPAPAPQKSAFFSFGNNANKTDALSLAPKSTFGVAAETNATNHIFGVPSGNTLGGNVLGSRAPGGSNTLVGGSNPVASGSNPLAGGSNPAAGGSNPLAGGSNPAAGGSNPLAGVSNPVAGGSNSGNQSNGNDTAANNTQSVSYGTPTDPPMGGNRQSGNGIPSSTPNLFASIQKENVWSLSVTAPNMFNLNNTTPTGQQNPGFAFGAPAGFNAGGSSSAFGGGAQPMHSSTFLMPDPNNSGGSNNNQPSMFSSIVQAQQPLFTPAPTAARSCPPINMNIPSAMAESPTFTPSPTHLIHTTPPSFDSTLVQPAPVPPSPGPAFNFGGKQSNVMFGFGQQQQPQQAGVYNFGGAPAAAGGAMQFNMGSGVKTAGRRVIKAMRRNPPR